MLSSEESKDVATLQNEVTHFKQKVQSLGFQNAQLKKLLNEDKRFSVAYSVESEGNYSTNTRQNRLTVDGSLTNPIKLHSKKESQAESQEQRLEEASSMIKRLLETDGQSEVPIYSKELDRKLDRLNLPEEEKASLKSIVVKLEEKNMILNSKVGDMKLLIEEMMSQFRELVSRDYIELQKIRKEIAKNELGMGSQNSSPHKTSYFKNFKTEFSTRNKRLSEDSAHLSNNLNISQTGSGQNVDIVNLVSVYHAENKRLKTELGSL